jgi:copper(I)-binding protein
MLMGLTRKLIDGGAIEMTLVFDKAGEIVVQIPVDRERQDHGVVTHGDMDHSEGSADK